jgi:hypothetical protein
VSTIDIVGEVKITTARLDRTLTLMQTLSDIEVKGMEATIPRSGADVSVPLGLSAGVAEGLFLAIYSPKKLIVRYTTADASHPGPVEFGIKGHHILTLTPDAGIVALAFSNPSDTEDVVVEYVVGAKRQSTDEDPDFYTDT